MAVLMRVTRNMSALKRTLTRSLGNIPLEPFKSVFNPALVDAYRVCITRCFSSFDGLGFEQAILPNLDALELKDRSNLLAQALHAYLPQSPDARERILLAILHPKGWGDSAIESSHDGISGWGVMPITTLVGQYGLGGLSRELEALKAMTGHFTSEFAIRFLILKDPTQVLATIQRWVSDPDPHVRRLVSEGTRPRLPWAMQLPVFIESPDAVLPLLRALRDDESEYVRRSVANHLNDIAKDHPDRIAQLACDWMQALEQQSVNAEEAKRRERLVKHACRTLIKQGHPLALTAFGIQAPQLAVVSLSVTTPKVNMGEALVFELTIQSGADAPQKLIIDYLLYFKKANGKVAPKVFKWSQQTLAAGATLTLQRKHGIRPITTRKYYAGEQQLAVRINGRDYPAKPFALVI